MSLSIVVEPEVDILINKETGKWIAFENAKDQERKVVKVTRKDQLVKRYGSEFAEVLWQKRKEMNKKVLDKFEHPMNCLVINVTDSCNLRCKYCYANNDNTGRFITKDTIVKAVRMFARNIYPDKLTVIFHGGEPLLAFNQIKNAITELKDVENTVYSVQTNGTLLTKEKIAFFKKNNFVIGLSIDGINEQNNSLRNVNHKVKNYTKNNLKILEENKEFMRPLVVIHKNNIKDIKRIINYFKRKGFDNVICNLLFEDGNFENCVLDDTLFEHMKYILDMMMEHFDGEEFSFSERDIRLLFRKTIYGFLDEYMCMNSPCGAGKETVAVDHKGNVFGCNVLFGNTKDNNKMGNIFENTVEEILSNEIDITKRDIQKIKPCTECPYKVICSGGGCCGFIQNQRNDILDKSIYCDYHYKMITYMIKSVMKHNQTNILINF